ncbi:argonaute/piwi family protein [Spirosoma jeollabukense]
MINNNRLWVLPEPQLKFGYNQTLPDPRDGLTLFGPFDKGEVNNFSVGIIGTPDGIVRFKQWMQNIRKPVYHSKIDLAKPFFPGFEEVYGITFNDQYYAQVIIEPKSLEQFYKFNDSHVRVARIVDLYVDELVRYQTEEERKVDLWFVIIPDMVYQLCRPKSQVSGEGTISEGIRSSYDRNNEGLFDNDDTRKLRTAYKYEKNFHNQLKIKLLKDKILTQVIKESTIAYQEFLNKKGEPIRDLKNFQTDIIWSLTTSIYYKVGGLPWKLSGIREGVCYIGLVFKNDDRQKDRRIACCAAQMFLDSGDGQVFKGAVGPWYNLKTKEYHLSKEGAIDLLTKALISFKKQYGVPREVFIHSRTDFNDEEWGGFQEAAKEVEKVVGVKISHEKTFKLFRDSDYPVMRGTLYEKDHRVAYLWSKGFIPRIQSVLGLETPNPLLIQINRGEADIRIVSQDILALTKLNYNSCRFSDGVPVTLKFADAIGEILTAGPNEGHAVLPFKFYI